MFICLSRVSFVQTVLFHAMVGNKDTENMDPTLQEITIWYCDERKCSEYILIFPKDCYFQTFHWLLTQFIEHLSATLIYMHFHQSRFTAEGTGK